MKKRNQQGFTLIELVIVIVILGILAVTAAPKLLDVQGDARISTLEGLEASLKGGVSIAYSKALIQGVSGTKTTPESTTSPVISMAYGYPEAIAATISTLIDTNDWVVGDDSSDTVRIYPKGGSFEGDSTTVYSDDGPSGNATDGACYVYYTQATSSTVPPVIDIVTTNC